MKSSQIYLLVAIIALAGVVFLVSTKIKKPLSPLAGLALAFIVSGIIFSDTRTASYSLIGLGVVLAGVDLIRRLKAKRD